MTTHITKKVPCFRAGANAISNKVNLVLYLDKEIIRESKDLGFNLSRTFENHETFNKEHVIILGNFYLYFLNSSKFRILFVQVFFGSTSKVLYLGLGMFSVIYGIDKFIILKQLLFSLVV